MLNTKLNSVPGITGSSFHKLCSCLFFSALFLLPLNAIYADLAEGQLNAEYIDTPASVSSSEPHLSKGPDGTIVLSWLEHQDDWTELRYSEFFNGAWQAAKTAARGDNWFVNWADFPSVTPISKDLWAAHWLVMQPEGGYSYDVAISLSHDRGDSWSKPISPHNDGTSSEHGFVSLFPWKEGVGALWLDGRAMAKTAEEDAENPAVMSLRAAVLFPGPRVASEYLVDNFVCDCCQTDVAIGVHGPMAVYRNRTEDEIRDIYISRVIDGEWEKGKPVGVDGWKIAGCPVNGPAIASQKLNVAVSWFTMADENPRLRFARSINGGESFSAPISISTGAVVGRTDVSLLDNGDAVVSWLRENPEHGGELVVRLVSAGDRISTAQVVAFTKTSRPAGFPQMVSNGQQLMMAWTDISGDEPRVKTATLDISLFDR